MRVLIADDQPRVRASLRLLLQRETEMNIVAEVSDFEGLLVQAKLSCPDLVLLDWGLPGVPSVDVIARLRAECSGVRVIAISGRPEVEQSALASGAVAFVSKADPPEKLLEAILAVNQAENS